MLTELRVRDLGVIDDLSVRFGPGMTALTGETGAGKTLLVEAVTLVLGGRAPAGLVRAGAEEALVEASFAVDRDDGAANRSALVLARAVPVTGRSRAWIDGRPVPVGVLAEAGRDLLDIHGQHDQQSLLVASAQRAALDGFAGVDLAPRSDARRRLAEVDARLASLGGDGGQRAREADVLAHQVGEITAAALSGPDEDEVLMEEESRLADMSAHRAAAALALSFLDEDAASGHGAAGAAAVDLLRRAETALAGRPAFASWQARLRDAATEAGDVASDLRRVVDTWEDDPGRLEEVQARRRLLADLRRKYGATLAEVEAFGVAAAARLGELEGAAEEAGRLAAERSAVEDELLAAEERVGASRRAAAPLMARAVAARLGDLAMAGAKFEIAVAGEPAGDDVSFLLGANPGEPLQPLARVASGGELARAMLALRLVAMGGPASMIFDEVDAGVGGAAALALAGALREIATGRQVLVVTHLAQVAAYADRQVSVEKLARDGRTVTRAGELGAEERLVELSRMLSGHPDSPTARAHAEELLASAGGGPASTTAGRLFD